VYLYTAFFKIKKYEFLGREVYYLSKKGREERQVKKGKGAGNESETILRRTRALGSEM